MTSQGDINTSIDSYSIKNVKYNERTIDISYPSISGIQDTQKQTKINDLLKSEAFRELSDFSNDKSNSTEDIIISLNNNILHKSYNFLSVSYSGDVMIKGAAYPRSIFTTVNVDLNSGNRIRLSEVISINDDFINIVRNTLNSYIDKNPEWKIVYMDLLNHDDNYFLDLFNKADSESNSDCFSYFTNDSLGLSFATFHAAGDHFEVEIKYADLGDVPKTNIK